MPRRPFQQIASLKITGRSGNEVFASAILHQDPHFLRANRIELVGTREHEISLLQVLHEGQLEWELHGQTIAQPASTKRRDHRRWGTGWVRGSGMTWGVGIAEDSIQPFGDIQILEAHDDLHDEYSRVLRAEYVFLQRPRDWFLARRSLRAPSGPKVTGSWKKVKALGLRYRLIQVIYERDDERVGQEVEHIELPGIEIGSADEGLDPPAFFEAAERLWRIIRVLLVFRHRQFVYPLIETRTGPGTYETKWHTVRLEARDREPAHIDPPFLGRTEPYLSRSIDHLLTVEHHCDLLHAAAVGYATSYRASVIEAGLTSVIEGLERLVEAFEQARGLSREAIATKRWKKIGRAARNAARPCAETDEELDAINRALSVPPTLRLGERIERMVSSLPRGVRNGLKELLIGADDMIKARNAIVHGRMIEDLDALHIHIVRAQTLFERMWLGFLKCGNMKDGGWAAYRVRTFDAERRQMDTGS